MGGLVVLCFLTGCGAGVARTDPVVISPQDMAKSQIYRANQLLDNISKLPPAQRQAVASVPATAESLAAAYRSDPETKKRIDDLGIKVADAPTSRPGPGRPGPRP